MTFTQAGGFPSRTPNWSLSVFYGGRPWTSRHGHSWPSSSVRFYAEAFGLEFNAHFSSFALGAYNTDSFFLLTVENWLDGSTPSSFGLLVDDVDARHATALDLGATEISPPTDYSWKPRCSVVDDPSGSRIQLSQG